tara:strand:- start:1877 stop:3925 length:2049 start_codon:yes stop_codon:yes gene_type:complete
MSSTGGMGRGSDTRIYAPRSESSHMYSENDGEDKYNPADPKYKEWEKEKKLNEDDVKEALNNKLKHIKILGHHGKAGAGEPESPDEADTVLDPRKDLQGELSRQTGPPGNRGHELDMATGAKTGTGSAMGHQFMASEPMDNAWSELLKEEGPHITWLTPEKSMAWVDGHGPYTSESIYAALKERGTWDNKTESISDTYYSQHGLENPKGEYEMPPTDPNLHEQEAFQEDMFDEDGNLKLSEPMEGAWSELLKAKNVFDGFEDDEDDEDFPSWESVDSHADEGPQLPEPPTADEMDENPRNETWHDEDTSNENRPFALMDNIELAHAFSDAQDNWQEANPDLVTEMAKEIDYRMQQNQDVGGFNPLWQDKNASEPMEGAWSELLKRETAKTMGGRRKKEKRAEFRPSTGQFKKPPGGQSGGPGSTMRRFKARMRGIQSGKKTGLMKPHLAVEMSHRGIKTKQPMSKDPARYRAYMGQQEAKKILGGARTVWSPHARYAERSTRAGPTGGGQLTGMAPGQAGQLRQPSLRRMGMPKMRKPRAPRMPKSMGTMGMPPMGDMSAVPPLPQAPPPLPQAPPDPSQMMMSEDKIAYSDLMKENYFDMTEIRTLLRRIARAKEQEAKESKKKAGTTSATEGPMPNHPAGVSGENDDMDPDGPTENDEMKANRLGLDPAGYLTSKRGHMG